MDEKVKIALSGFCGALAALAENYGLILTLCCTFILIDLATGLAKAKIQGKINSDTGYKGFWRKAAMLAAWYSQASGGANVPVDYTQVRHVKKPSGARPGMVIYDPYQTIFVTPDEALVKALRVK